MPKQLPQVPIAWTRHPQTRGTIFDQQRQQEPGIFAIDLLLANPLCLVTLASIRK